jgi:hypothetical protein
VRFSQGSIIAFGGFVIGFVAGGVAFRSSGCPASTARPAEARPLEARGELPTGAELVAAHLGEAALRRIVREEVTAAFAAQQRTADCAEHDEAAPTAATEPEMSAEASRAYDRARATIDAAIARGSWTQADRAQLQANVASLPKARRDELRLAVAAALNQRKLVPDHRGPAM